MTDEALLTFAFEPTDDMITRLEYVYRHGFISGVLSAFAQVAADHEVTEAFMAEAAVEAGRVANQIHLLRRQAEDGAWLVLPMAPERRHRYVEWREPDPNQPRPLPAELDPEDGA